MNENLHKKYHFIAIGGSVMHHLAIALHRSGHQVSGSDDGFYEPSQSNLQRFGLLPEQTGWFPEKITPQLDAIVLGMHARADNPELLRAQELGLPIYSFPEFFYNFSRDKQRVVIAGSHGKTTITSMILHVLRENGRKFDYMVGAEIEGFDGMVKLSDAPVIIMEGDEYLTSPLDKTPKFLHYHHHIALISGIAWDHANVFPTEEFYVKQFELLADSTPKGGSLVYCDEDPIGSIIGNKQREDVNQLPYVTHLHEINDEQVFLKTATGKVPVQVFGTHNMQNISGAMQVCKRIGITDEEFYRAISTFKGAAKRLQLLAQKGNTYVYRDFAHAPSKVEATVRAVQERFPKHTIVACLELHTFSSLSRNFLPKYQHTLGNANLTAVYFNPEVVAGKRLESFSEQDVTAAFSQPNLQVFTESRLVEAWVRQQNPENTVFLLMTSANFGGIDLQQLANTLVR
ncbi:Mur ligase middle domain protein [Flammeovirgaceae bacterium 311]|nr:Mur ligase middle domain protein [Flammeovirgaceae bacterium 311]